ncbi:hypothetical protein GOODEAATRI_005798, partial [Goodea atripinnis]
MLRRSISSLTPAVVRQDVNFLESREISLHRITVNLKTDRFDAVSFLHRVSEHVETKTVNMWYYCDRMLASVQLLENRIISASLWKSSMDRA